VPYCPKCHAEYVAGKTRCIDCDVDLVEELPFEDPEHPRYTFEVLTESKGEILTRLIKAELDAAGIPSVLSGDMLGTVHIYPAHDSTIWVPTRHLPQAKEILEQVLATAEDDATAEAETELLYCDNCGAEVPPDATACPNCGEAFDEADAKSD